MKHYSFHFLLTMLFCIHGVTTFAHDIAVKNSDGVTIYYCFTNETELAVSYRGNSWSHYNGEYSGCIIIPKSVIYSGKEYCVTSIGTLAFSDCSGLTSITIPNSVTSIGDNAFLDCSSLTSMTIPNSVTSISELAFNNCSGLTSIKVDNGNTIYDSRNDCNALIEKATNTLIAGCAKTIIPNSVTSIGGRAFFGRNSLTSIEIPNSVTSIGYMAFSCCI